MRPDASALALNAPARTEFATISPRGVTLHFTFGTSSMMDFVKNVGAARRNRTTPSHARAQGSVGSRAPPQWIHFVRKAA